MKHVVKLVLVGAASLAGTTVVAQTQTSAPAAQNGQSERRICRRMPETGSLVATRRQCFTQAEWDRIAESQQSGAQRLVEGLSTRPGGN